MSDESLSAAERAAVKERAQELRTAKRGGKAKQEADVLAVIADLPDADRVLAEKLHALVLGVAPDLSPKLWYGMPGYAKDGKVLCFFQAASKYDTRFSTFAFNDVPVRLEDGNFWPTAFAVTKLTKADEQRLAVLVKRAAGVG